MASSQNEFRLLKTTGVARVIWLSVSTLAKLRFTGTLITESAKRRSTGTARWCVAESLDVIVGKGLRAFRGDLL
jgi:hypothetical protein